MGKKGPPPRTAAPTEESLLAAVLAAPDADAPRLAYADWMAKHGQPERAEFIRLQVERARRPFRDLERLYPGERERALLAAHGEAWLAPLPERVRPCVTFERGFPARAQCEIIDFLAWDDALWQVAPLTVVHLVDSVLGCGDYREGLDKDAEMKALAAKPQLARLRGLDLHESGYFVLA